MRKAVLFLSLLIIPFLSHAQKLLGATEATIIDSMKNKDMFNPGINHYTDGSIVLTYLNYMRKDGTIKYENDYLLVSDKYMLEKGKCVMVIELYKYLYMEDFRKRINDDPQKYKKTNDTVWTDKKNNLQVKITPMPEQRFFMVQYEPIQ